MRVRQLRESDLDAAMDLVRAASWNQTRADWRRLLALAPDSCFAGVVGDEMVATTTVVTYDDAVSWVGMVLVDPAHRRTGCGTKIFEHAIDAIGDAVAVGLDATERGRPLYRRHGFRTVTPVVRFDGELEPVERPRSIREIGPTDRTTVFGLDADACGVDRSVLLSQLLSERDVTGFVHGQGGDVRGYAILRPGRERWQLGPVVAGTADVLEGLLAAAAVRLDGESVVVDVPTPESVSDALTRAGLSAQRRLERMAYPSAEPLLAGSDTVAAAGLELG